jgi:hypothetical protein
MTGLSNEQLTELVARVHTAHGGGFTSRGRPYALGLFGSVALVVCLLRKNLTQAFVGAIFGVSQATVSRRWDLLRPLIGQVLAEFVPDPAEVVGAGTMLVTARCAPPGTGGTSLICTRPRSDILGWTSRSPPR